MSAHHTFKCNSWKVLLAVKIKKKIKEKGKRNWQQALTQETFYYAENTGYITLNLNSKQVTA